MAITFVAVDGGGASGSQNILFSPDGIPGLVSSGVRSAITSSTPNTVTGSFYGFNFDSFGAPSATVLPQGAVGGAGYAFLDAAVRLLEVPGRRPLACWALACSASRRQAPPGLTRRSLG